MTLKSIKKDAPGIRDDSRGQPKHPKPRKMTDVDKIDAIVKQVVWATSPSDDPTRSA